MKLSDLKTGDEFRFKNSRSACTYEFAGANNSIGVYGYTSKQSGYLYGTGQDCAIELLKRKEPTMKSKYNVGDRVILKPEHPGLTAKGYPSFICDMEKYLGQVIAVQDTDREGRYDVPFFRGPENCAFADSWVTRVGLKVKGSELKKGETFMVSGFSDLITERTVFQALEDDSTKPSSVLVLEGYCKGQKSYCLPGSTFVIVEPPTTEATMNPETQGPRKLPEMTFQELHKTLVDSKACWASSGPVTLFLRLQKLSVKILNNPEMSVPFTIFHVWEAVKAGHITQAEASWLWDRCNNLAPTGIPKPGDFGSPSFYVAIKEWMNPEPKPKLGDLKPGTKIKVSQGNTYVVLGNPATPLSNGDVPLMLPDFTLASAAKDWTWFEVLK